MTNGRLFHGGVSGLQIGQRILPPNSPERAAISGRVSDRDRANGHARLDRVYITSDRQSATVYASARPYGDVYEVKPYGSMESDPDAPGMSWTCEYAEIVRVVQRRVKFKKKRLESWVRKSEAVL